jgi:hypothetical protein
MIIDDSTKVRPQGARNEIMRRREMPGRQASDTAGLNARCLGRQHLRSELGLQRRILPACLPVSFVCHFRRHFLQHLTDLRTTDHVTKNTCRTPCAPSPSTGAGGDMGSQKCGIVGKSQPVLIMIDPIISTRTRNSIICTCVRACVRACVICALLVPHLEERWCPSHRWRGHGLSFSSVVWPWSMLSWVSARTVRSRRHPGLRGRRPLLRGAAAAQQVGAPCGWRS